jgi:hypothetical protein
MILLTGAQTRRLRFVNGGSYAGGLGPVRVNVAVSVTVCQSRAT